MRSERASTIVGLASAFGRGVPVRRQFHVLVLAGKIKRTSVMKKSFVTVMGVISLLAPSGAAAELRHVRINVLGMD
jgi:hypothetical protein